MESVAKSLIDMVSARTGAALVLSARKAGLQLNDLVVLLVLREFAPDPSEPSLMVSVRELAEVAELVGMTKSQVETSLKRLTELGAVTREQRDKRNREVAVTTLMPLAFRVLDGSTVAADCALPPMLRGLLAGECGDLIEAVQAAWDNCTMPDPSVGSMYRGGGEGWARVEALLRARVDEATATIEAAVEEQEERAARRERGVYQVRVTGGGVVEVNAHAVYAAAPAPCDVELAVEVLSIAEQLRPGTITLANVHERLAEALYSRHIGFARGMDAGRAVRVIGKEMTKDRWGRPFAIRDAWYTCCAAAITRPGARHPEAAETRLS